MDDEDQLIAAVDPTTVDGEEGKLADVRVDRILEHVEDSLQLEDPLEAALGASSGDLMLMQYRLRQALDETLQQTPDSLTALTEVMPTLNTFMKLNQQVDRSVHLLLKIKTAKGRALDSAPGRAARQPLTVGREEIDF